MQGPTRTPHESNLIGPFCYAYFLFFFIIIIGMKDSSFNTTNQNTYKSNNLTSLNDR